MEADCYDSQERVVLEGRVMFRETRRTLHVQTHVVKGRIESSERKTKPTRVIVGVHCDRPMGGESDVVDRKILPVSY